MIEVVVTYNNDFGGTPYNAASIKTQTSNINEALNYAFRYTQITDGSWSKKIGSVANDNVEVLHYRNDIPNCLCVIREYRSMLEQMKAQNESRDSLHK